MRIFYIIHYFPPELNGGATRASELARLWAQAGHDVTILTGFPNHPNGRIPEKYRGKLFQEEFIDGYRVRRSYIYATPNKGFARRIFNHLSLMVSTVIGSVLKERPDVIIASSPPLFMGISGYLLSRLKRVPYVFEVRDIWPQQAIDLGMLQNRHIIRTMEALELFLYRNAAKIIGVAESTKRLLSERGIPAEKIDTIFNGTDLVQPASDSRLYEPQLESLLEGKFVVSYIGTMGLSQGLAVILDAAKCLEEANPLVHFLLVGDGAERERLESLSRTLELANVTFLPPQPRNKIPRLLAKSRATLVLLKDLPLFRSTIPSKIFEIMACGTPLILGVRGEAQSIVQQSGAGICIEPENAGSLIEAVEMLCTQPNLCSQLAANGPKFVRDHFDRSHLASRYSELLQQVALSR
jgi:glycosyltransferase involved in cell wall biosynthesis